MLPQDVWLPSPEFSWHSFSEEFPQVEPIEDREELVQRLARNVADAERIWLISGDGRLGNYPKATVVEDALENWEQRQVWEYPPLTLKLYEKNG